MAPIHYPGHKYLGPGTWDYSQTPVDKDDQIAQAHDIHYRDAVSDQDIYDADSEAIGQFYDDFKENWNPHSLLGLTGIGIKHLTEKAWGRPIYGMPKRPNPLTPPQTPAKMNRNNEPHPGSSSTPIDMEVATNDAVPSEQAPGNNAQNNAAPSVGQQVGQISICKIARNFGPGLYKFHKSWIVCTWGFQYQRISTVNQTSFGTWTTTPLARFPVHKIQPYMAKAEWDQLPGTSYAHSCHVKVIPKGFRAPFQTGTTISSAANSQMLVFGKIGSGFNNTYNVGYGLPSATSGDPTKMVTFDTTIVPSYTDLFYGNPTSEINGAATGFPRRIESHLGLAGYTGAESRNDALFIQNAKTFDMRTQVGMPMENYTFEFKEAPLKYGYHAQQTTLDSIIVQGDPITYSRINSGFNRTHQNRTRINVTNEQSIMTDNDASSQPHSRQPLITPGGTVKWDEDYDQMIEKSSYIGTLNDTSEPKIQPDLCFGVDAPLTSNPFAATPEFAHVMGYWQVDCELIVGSHVGTEHVKVPTIKHHLLRYIHESGLKGFNDYNVCAQNRILFPAVYVSPPSTKKRKMPAV